jgi:hypothetical protein
MTNAFRKTDLKMALRTNNTKGNLTFAQKLCPDTFSLSGVYKPTCLDCNKEYVGQTDRSLPMRYKEHMTSF